MPPKWYVDFRYALVNFFRWLSKTIEKDTWGYEWCSKCRGDGIYPVSGMWVQPDGWKICPDCRGNRWQHCVHKDWKFVGIIDTSGKTCEQILKEYAEKGERGDNVQEDKSKD